MGKSPRGEASDASMKKHFVTVQPNLAAEDYFVVLSEETTLGGDLDSPSTGPAGASSYLAILRVHQHFGGDKY